MSHMKSLSFRSSIQHSVSRGPVPKSGYEEFFPSNPNGGKLRGPSPHTVGHVGPQPNATAELGASTLNEIRRRDPRTLAWHRMPLIHYFSIRSYVRVVDWVRQTKKKGNPFGLPVDSNWRMEQNYSEGASPSSLPWRIALSRSSRRLARSAARLTSSEPTSSSMACSAPSPLRKPSRTTRV
jgi:hypothetical protein